MPLQSVYLNGGFIGTTTSYQLASSVAAGEQAYTTPGSYSWTCPDGVTSVSVVCVGGGGGGGSTGFSGGGGGGGGGLGWKNNITVVPGNSYTVVVGISGTRDSTTHGGDSYFIDSSTVAGLGGLSSTDASGGTGGGYVGDGGGNGGTPNNSGTADSTGGGGAGGYSGNGGGSAINTNGTAGSGGGGGGGGAGGSSDAASGGGGVGLEGEGSSGAGGVYTGGDAGAGGGGGSGGTAGGAGTSRPNNGGGNYGGGGGGAELNNEAGNGADGAVRIIWGDNRSFPSTNTADGQGDAITTPSNDGIFNLQAVLENLAPPNIVTNGLVLALDAGDPRSYPGTGTTWFDTSGNDNNGTIQSGVSYNTKYFTFDGTTNGYVSLPLLSSSTTNITMLALVNMPASDGGAIFFNGNSGGYGIGVGSSTFDNNGNDAIGLFQLVRWIDSNITWGTGWMMVGLSLNGSSVPSFIKNNNIIGTFSGTAPNTPVTNAALGVDAHGGSRNFAGDIAWAAFYSRELSISEIQQNYNALRGRFGL